MEEFMSSLKNLNKKYKSWRFEEMFSNEDLSTKRNHIKDIIATI
jgi:hypothetical protein